MRGGLGFAIVVTATLVAGEARAQRLLLSDLSGDGDEAGAMGLVLRSMLRGGSRPLVGWDELDRALERVPDARAGGWRVVDASSAAILKEVGADRLLTGEASRDDVGLQLSLRVHDATGAQLAAVTVHGSRGEIAALPLEGARRVAAALGTAVAPPPEVSLGELRPFVRAAALLADRNAEGAAEALAVASPEVAARVAGAREVAELVERNPALPARARMVAALAAGDPGEALRLGASDPAKSVEGRAQAVLANLALSNVAAAGKQLAALRHEHSDALGLARARFALKKGHKAEAEKELLALLDKSPPYPPALAFIASLPPGALRPDLEAASLVAARRVSLTHPGVATALGVRAARSGQRGSDALGLIRIDDLGAAELTEIDKLTARDGSVTARSLQSGLATRRGAHAVELPGTRAPVKPAQARTLGEQTAETQEIAARLGPLLDAFPPLAARRGGAAVLHAQKGSEPPWSIWAVNANPLRFALAQALAGAPYALGVTFGEGEVGELSHDSLARLASHASAQTSYVVLYRITVESSDARVVLSLYDLAESQLYEFDGLLPGRRLGLVRRNPLLWPFGGLLLVLLVAWLVVFVLRTGEIFVEIRRDPGAEQEALVLLVSRKQKPPSIRDLSAFHRRHANGVTRKHSRKIENVLARGEFSRVPVGGWWVHLIGTYVKGGEVREIPEGLTQRVVVTMRGVVRCQLDLDPNATEYRVRVSDGALPIAGAAVFLDGNREKPLATDGSGQVALHVPKGKHVVHVAVGEEQFTRDIYSVGGKVQVLGFDLPRERREKELARGLEVSVEDDSWKSKVLTEVPSAAPAGAEATLRSSDQFSVDLPAGFHIPPAEPLSATAAAAPLANQRPPAPAGNAPARPAGPSGLSRYQRLSELGRGAMGVVWKGRDLVLEREVAIKIISDEVRRVPMALEMFFQEARAMAALNHPNLVTVFDQGQDGDETFLVMELIDGRTLETLLQERGGALPLDEALTLADQLCAGLAYAHGRRILHRDIKPANIFLTSDGVVKIGDFGLARAVQQARLTQTKVCGTPLYMSPEQIRGTGIDFRSDLYALGCTLFELCTGQPPFTTGEVLYHHMHTPPPKPSSLKPDVPPDVDALILSCLEKDLAARVESAEALRKAVRPLRARFSA